MITDIHTHIPAPGAIASLDPSAGDDFSPEENFLYSAGIHPWRSGSFTGADLQRLVLMAADPRVAAIGEAGLDNRRGASRESQLALLERHIDLSESLRKPLILHAVGCFPDLIALKNMRRPEMAWIIHGFRGKPQLARELVRHGFYISAGEHFNPAALAEIPEEKLLVETDESQLSPAEIAAKHGISLQRTEQNADRLFLSHKMH